MLFGYGHTAIRTHAYGRPLEPTDPPIYMPSPLRCINLDTSSAQNRYSPYLAGIRGLKRPRLEHILVGIRYVWYPMTTFCKNLLTPLSDRTRAMRAGMSPRDVIIFEENKSLEKLVDPYVMFSGDDMRNRMCDKPLFEVS